jgi:predicted ester cyclase
MRKGVKLRPPPSTNNGPPTGRQMEFKGITIHRFEDGKIVEEREAYDDLSVLQ